MNQREKMSAIFEDEMPRLKKLMRVPEKAPIYVLIIDDNELAVIGMRTVLGHWNNLGATTVIVSDGQVPFIDLRNHIILLDAEMAKVDNTAIFDWLCAQGYSGIVASTLFYGLNEPVRVGKLYKYHFGYKVNIGRSFSTAVEFVKFMNELIEDAEKHR